MSTIFVGQTVRFEFTVTDQDDAIVDLSTAASYDLTFERPGGQSAFVRTPAFITDGTDGQIFYVTPLDELDIDGGWKVQGNVVDAGGEEYPTDIERFSVATKIIREVI